jgi:hypothetical protein
VLTETNLDEIKYASVVLECAAIDMICDKADRRFHLCPMGSTAEHRSIAKTITSADAGASKKYLRDHLKARLQLPIPA